MEEIIVNGEPQIVTEIRKLVLETFKDLVFIEEGHKYYLHGKEIPSVSAITHQFKPHFDDIKMSEHYARKHGQTPEYWRDMWKFNNLRATTTGTEVHMFGEAMTYIRMGRPDLMPEPMKRFYNQEKGWLIPTRPKEEAIIKYFSEMSPYDYPVLAETKVFNNFNPEKPHIDTDYCGTFDILYYTLDPVNPENNGLKLRDYKTNASLTSDYARDKNKMCKKPFKDLYDESLSMYKLQLLSLIHI